MKEDKKRKCFLRQIARKRPRAARISSSGVMQQVSQSTTDDEAVAAVDASVPLKSSSFKGPFIPTSVLCIHSYLESKDSKEWNCGACTLLNPISRRRCQACGSRASFMSCEPLDNPLPRTVYSTPGKDNPLQAETSIAIRLVQKLHTPKTRKIDDCLPKLSGKSSPRLAKELDVNGRSCVSSTLAETNKIERSERNENESKRVLIRERLSSTDPMGNKPSDRGKCPNAIKNARSVPTPQNQETPILAKENYHQLQVTLARVLDELDNMYKFIQTQKEDTRSLREQNGDIMLAQKQLLNANRKMKASLAILETGMNVRHSEPEVASISNDTPSNVSPEYYCITTAGAVILLEDIKSLTNVAQLGGTKHNRWFNWSSSLPYTCLSSGGITMMLTGPEGDPAKGLFAKVGRDQALLFLSRRQYYRYKASARMKKSSGVTTLNGMTDPLQNGSFSRLEG